MGGLSPYQCLQDEVCALGNTDLWQDCHFVTEGRIHVEETTMLGNRSIEAMAPLSIGYVDFRPRWNQKNAAVVTMRSSDRL